MTDANVQPQYTLRHNMKHCTNRVSELLTLCIDLQLLQNLLFRARQLLDQSKEEMAKVPQNVFEQLNVVKQLQVPLTKAQMKAWARLRIATRRSTSRTLTWASSAR